MGKIKFYLLIKRMDYRMKRIFDSKALAITIIFLFVTLAFSPSFHANIHNREILNGELIEITSGFYGISSEKHKVQLSQEETQELEILFDLIKQQLYKAESKEETTEIFNEAIIKLDKYGLLPDSMDVNRAQRLVIDKYQNSNAMKLIEFVYGRHQETLDDDENIICLVAGTSSETNFYTLLTQFVLSLLIHFNAPGELWVVVYFVLDTIDFYRPVCLGRIIEYGNANGWVFTIGLNGIKTWNGELDDGMIIPFWPFEAGAIGFTGLQIRTPNLSFYLGSALKVCLDSK